MNPGNSRISQVIQHSSDQEAGVNVCRQRDGAQEQRPIRGEGGSRVLRRGRSRRIHGAGARRITAGACRMHGAGAQLHAQLREQLHVQVREQLHAQLHQWSRCMK